MTVQQFRNSQVQARFHEVMTAANTADAAYEVVCQYIEDPWRALAEVLAATNRLGDMPDQLGRAAAGIVSHHLMRAVRNEVDNAPYRVEA